MLSSFLLLAKSFVALGALLLHVACSSFQPVFVELWPDATKLYPGLSGRRAGSQCGGGRVVVTVAQIKGCVVECGWLEGLPDSTVLRVHGLLGPDEVASCEDGQLVVVVPMAVAREVCKFTDLEKLGRMHGVRDQYRSLSAVQAALRVHVCETRCPVVRLRLSGPTWVRKKSLKKVEFLFMKPLEDAARVKFGKVVESGSAPVDGQGQDLRPRRYVFTEPVIPSTVCDDVLPAVAATPPARFPPRPLKLSAKMDIVRKWVEASSSYALAEGPCGVCGRNVRLSGRESISLDDEWIALLVGCGTDATRNVSAGVGGLERVLLHDAVSIARNTVEVCVDCMRFYRRGRLPKLSLANGLWLGEVPEQLRALNFMEKLMVARYRHNVCVVTVRGGARQMRANAVVLAQPVAKFWRALPPKPGELAEMVAVLCTGPSAPTNEDLKRAPVFIRKDVVLRALEWLRTNHCDYADLEIDRDSLELYPEDRPVVEWIYLPSDGKDPEEGNAVNENGERADIGGDVDEPCPFVVEGICAEDVVDMSYDERMELALDHLKRGGRILSYGQSRSPESIYHNPRLYPGMFPWLFPYGLGGFENENIISPVARKTHVRWMLSYADRRFQVDEYFPFLVYNQEQIRTSSRGAFALVERRNFEDVVDKILNVREDALGELLRRSRETGYTKPETAEEKKCFELLSLIDHVGGHVPGSNTRKKWQRSEIRSMIYRYGLPIFFITFAPSESASPVCLYLCGEKVDLDSYVPLMTHDKERLEATVRNPVACARFFDLMVRLFVEHVLRADTEDEGLFGRTSAYYGTVEEQGRKTLHLHALLWIAGSLSPEEIRRRVREGESLFVDELLAWLDSCVQGQCNSGGIKDATDRLMQKGKPLPGSASRSPAWADPRVCLPTKPLPGDDADEQQRRKWFEQVCAITDEIVALVNVHDKRHPHGCQRPPDFQCRGRFPRELEPVSKVDFDTGAITLKKGEAWVNTFNTVLTYLLRCNTDVTCLLSGTSVRAVIAYVTDYITKRTLKTHTMFDVILGVYNAKDELVASCGSRTDAARRLITKIVNGFTSRVQLGGPAVCAELLGFPDHYTNKRFKVVYWRSYVRFVDRAFGESTDDVARHGGEVDRGDLVVLGRSDGRIVGYNRLDDYVYRPHEFEYHTLYDYLSTTDVERRRRSVASDSSNEPHDENNENANSEMSDEDSEEVCPRGRARFRFLHGHAKQSTHAVVRVSRKEGYVMNFAGGLIPRPDTGDREMYCKTMLTLFSPGGWRTGCELKEAGESWEDAFDRARFAPEHLEVMKNMNLLYECHDARDDYAAQRRAASAVGHLAPLFLDNTSMEVDASGLLAGTRLDNDDLGAFPENFDQFAIEGPQTAGVHGQMDAITSFLTGELGEPPRKDLQRDYVSSAARVFEAADSVPLRDRREWKKLLEAERRNVLTSVRQPESTEECLGDDNRATATGNGDPNTVGALDEVAFRFHTGTKDSNQVTDGVSTEDLRKRVRELYALNKEQYLAFSIIVDHLVGKNQGPLKMVLTGMGGTGKTRVIDAVSYFLERRHESHRFLVMAPTGAAASLLGGSTYHSVLGLGRGGADATPLQLGRVRDRLARVDLLLLDEISMVSCADFYHICERMCLAFDRATEAFAGRHFVVAGDFTQLPPAGPKKFALYSAAVGMHSSRHDIEKQKNSLGKGVWHQFVTVVILKENMRQRGRGIRDIRYRVALENMRYGACDDADIRLLDSRLLSHAANRGNLRSDRYSFVSIIVPLNSHRDAINALYCERFARANNQPLHTFYSVDRLTTSRAEDSLRSSLVNAKHPSYNLRGGMTEAFRMTLWDIPPGLSENLPGKLTICVGMPVMLKNNEATELGVTNGSEGFVYGWESRALSSGREALTTLFVRLKNPPKVINIPGLPPNVVPVVAAAESIKCQLPNDSVVSVVREQVSAVLNFAITDFNSQGRTREVNVVDLRQCRGPQSVYTCLSRSSSIENTLILHTWDHGKVRNGIRADLMRELRELEILNHVTQMKCDGVLPDSIKGSTRAELMKSYQDHFGARYVPDGVHKALRWTELRDSDLRPPAKRGEWRMVERKKRFVGPADANGKGKKPKLVAEGRYTAANLESARLGLSYVPMFGIKRPNPSTRSGAPRLGTDMTSIRDRSTFLQRLRWDAVDWSCGYDCLLRVMLMLYRDYPRSWAKFCDQSGFARDLTQHLRAVPEQTTLEAVREVVRDTLSREDPRAFVRRGRALAAIDQLVEGFCAVDGEYGHQFQYCSSCGTVRNVVDLRSFLWSTAYNADMRRRAGAAGTAQLIASVIGEHGRIPCGYCEKPLVRIATKFTVPPALIALEIPAEDIRFSEVRIDPKFTVRLATDVHSWTLVAVVYLGGNHFTCRLIGRDSAVWYYDGIQNDGVCVEEDSRTTDLAVSDGAKACLVVYALQPDMLV